MRSWLLSAGMAWLVGSGCGTQVREARAVQPNPLANRQAPDDEARSVTLQIFERTYLLPRLRIRSAAEFVAVSRDRLRFHVGILGSSDLDVSTRDLKVWLEDDSGRKLLCEERQVPRIVRFVIGRQDVYEGRADFVFHDPDLISGQRQW